MGVYPAPAVERAMKVQEVILRAMSGEFAWVQAAEILGLSARSMRRWRARYEEHGYNGLYDRRTRRPSPQRVPVATVERVLRGSIESGMPTSTCGTFTRSCSGTMASG